MKQTLKLIIGLCILLIIAGSFILYLSLPLLTGTTIILATRPVDPFDLLRGQYMTINYEINRVKGLKAMPGESVYVSLQPDKEGIWRQVAAGAEKPGSGVFIRGRVKDPARVEYGIEQYFFEQGAQIPATSITVEAKVDSTGRASIVQLLHKGKPVEIKYRQREYS